MQAYLNRLSLQVKVILVNIFGGIVDCTTIANGVIAACRETKLKLPLIVRLEGVLCMRPCVHEYMCYY